MWSIIISLSVLSVLVVAAIFIRRVIQQWSQKAQAAGYASLGDYLRAAPGSDIEKRDAVDMALKGFLLCMAGLVFPPLLLIGLAPLYFGARKVALGVLGLGLFEDGEEHA